ncbi:MAG: FAD-dependent oxidoreductase [Bryobacterales bacterium]|nr:FAD-dependent oxidoreductase [Bryobacterales bacterium]
MGRYAGACHLLFVVVCATCAKAEDYTVLDIQKVPLTGDASQAVVRVTVPDQVTEISCDVLVAGAGMGGIGASLALSSRGHTVCLTEETDWVGGQATSGGVSALDENRFLEFAGATRTYARFRAGIRDWYRKNTKLTPAAAAWENLNPGDCYVSPLCFEPKAGVTVLEDMLRKPGVNLYLRTSIFAIQRRGAAIESALAWQFDQRRVIRFRVRFVLDATEMGDLLPLAKIPYVVGSEPKSETGEPDAPAVANPSCVQSFTYPFVIEHAEGPSPRAAKPDGYDKILQRQGFSLRVNYPEEFGWKGWVQYRMFGDDPPVPNNMSPGPFFSWRRLLNARNFEIGVPHDIALMNWPRQDYGVESPLDREPAELAGILQRAKQTSAAFLYWLQNDLPRDGKSGKGYPELALRPDEMGSVDGMSKYPYIRESRRMLARGRVAEQDIVDEFQKGPRARWFADSIGTGFYMVDIHPCGANEHGRMRMPKPFQIPMSAMMPLDALNFLPAGKNLGVTHLTNGAFRLHPVEWNIGESAGAIAGLWLERGTEPVVADVQRVLAQQGVPMVWFDDMGADHPAFAAIQLAALRGIYPMQSADLHASPDAPVTRAEAAVAIAAYFGKGLNAEEAVKFVTQKGWMATDHRNWFHEDLPFYWTDWREDELPAHLPALTFHRSGPVRRWELATRLAAN